MRRITVGENDDNQRVDRFLKKYFEKAPLSFIYKNLRKKNIKVNGKRARPEDFLKVGDQIDLYLGDETIDKFRREKKMKKNSKYPDILFEDAHVILMKKKVGILSHNDKKTYEDNMVDRMVDYLIFKEEYHPGREQTFRPGICNRLDRNTSGIIIGGKDGETLRELNQGIRRHRIGKYYLALVRGRVEGDFDLSLRLSKNENNEVFVGDGGKESRTKFKVLTTNGNYSLLSCDLITGRTHQIRASLKYAGHPIVGDTKYGDGNTNAYFRNCFHYRSQFLHNYGVSFHMEEGNLAYLKDRYFYYPPEKLEAEILEGLFPGKREDWPW